MFSLRAAELLVVAVVGGALALGGAAFLGKLGSHTTIQQIARPSVTNTSAAPAPVRGLTPERVYQEDAPGVVQITATSVTRVQSDPFGFLPSTPQTTQSLGSGFVIDRAGHIVTNYHVIAGAQKVQVSFSSQDELAATVVGSDKSTDVAVLKIDTHSRALTPLPLGDSDAVRVGDPVYAIGNPFGLSRTLTAGLVSAVGRQIFAPNNQPVENAIQTDAAINHGNSGGPLIDDEGRVIGVTSQIQTGSTDANSGSVGIGFAIPIDTVRDVAAQIIANGKAQHPELGVSTVVLTAQVARLFNLPTTHGLLVEQVTKGSAADKAGIKGGTTSVVVSGESYVVGGDIITKLDGQPVSSYQQIVTAVLAKKPGDKMTIELWRKGAQKTVTVKLGVRPG
ncbi:MAG TPA: trypsin-like peptidase domain-containing protein [Gaiellaceae bacterium]|jgi:S1-C subfamily serine protease|nr:trypsin-like peptidase domain-containing protein [Gaiellaceae bacterium]